MMPAELKNVAKNTTEVSADYQYNDADFNSSNMIFTVPLAAMGLKNDVALSFTVTAIDAGDTGLKTDRLGPMSFNPAKPKFIGTGLPITGVPAFGSSTLKTAKGAGYTLKSSQTGLLLMYRNQNSVRESDVIKLK